MREFITPEAIKMVEGESLNWKKENPFTITISVSTVEGRVHCFEYEIAKKMLSLFEESPSSYYIVDFYCEIPDAEKIIVAFAKANKSGILPLYIKPEIIITDEPFLNKK